YLKPNILDNTKKTPLHWACIHNHLQIVNTIISHASFKNEYLLQQDIEGKTCLHYAVKLSDYGSYENIELIQLLLNTNRKLLEIKDKNGYTVLTYAKQMKRDHVSKLLIEEFGAKIQKLKKIQD